MDKRAGISKKEYDRIHTWIRNNHGSATCCYNENCKRISTRFEWALKKGCKYKKDVSCFIQLCKKCHIEYDGHQPHKLHTLRDEEVMRKINDAKKKKIDQFSKNGEFIKTWDSALDAAVELGLNRVHICNAMIKKHRSGGFYWQLHVPGWPPHYLVNNKKTTIPSSTTK